MGIATAAAISAGVGLYASNQASKQADKAGKRQQQAMDQQAQVAQEQLDFGKAQYQDWKDLYMPALTDLRTMAYEEQRPNFAAISADVDKSFDTSQDINRRQMERYGVKPTDGSFQASETQYGLGRAMATVGANNAARQQAKDSQFNRLASFANLSNGMQATANGTVNTGFGNMMNAYGNQANLYGQQANQYSQAAAAGAQMFGRGLSGMINAWGQSGTGTPSSGITGGANTWNMNNWYGQQQPYIPGGG